MTSLFSPDLSGLSVRHPQLVVRLSPSALLPSRYSVTFTPHKTINLAVKNIFLSAIPMSARAKI